MKRLQGHVYRVGASIRTHGMSCTSGVDAVNSYLVPQIDLGLRIIPHSTSFMRTLQSWTNQLQDDILLAQGAWLRKPNRDAFCEVTGMTDLPRYCRYTRTALTVQRLNTCDCVLPPTAWSRLAALSPEASREELAATVNRRSLPSGRNRVVDALVGHSLGLKAVRYEYNRADFSRTPVQMEMAQTGEGASPIDHVRPKWWMPTKSPNRMFQTEKLGLRYSVYPDGSTDGHTTGVFRVRSSDRR
jgi:hypothetical protein